MTVRKQGPGFTLVELMVVVAIILVFVTTVVFGYIDHDVRRQRAERVRLDRRAS